MAILSLFHDVCNVAPPFFPSKSKKCIIKMRLRKLGNSIKLPAFTSLRQIREQVERKEDDGFKRADSAGILIGLASKTKLKND